jgi:putative methylase
MSQIRSKKELEIILSKLKGFENSKIREEQYITPSSIAAEVIWKAYFNGDVQDMNIADLGCGTGIFGIGCLIMGAKTVYFVDIDKEALDICALNIAKVKSEGLKIGEAILIEKDAKNFEINDTDTVFTNPPFGTKKKHADIDFLTTAFRIAKRTYSFHKTSTSDFIIKTARLNNMKVSERLDFDFMLWNTMKYHTKKKQLIEVSCFIFEK